MTARIFTFDQLMVSPLNVRTNIEDAEATGALEASIEARGLLNPLIVHPIAPDADWHEGCATHAVLAGGRRLRAIGKLIAAGRLPADWPIETIERDLDEAEITELSLAENLLRRDLNPYEVHAAIARAQEQGASVADIAANLGQKESWVRQQLRLGLLAPAIFDAYASGDLSFDQARAYAATEDRALQLHVWRQLKDRAEWEHRPARIHAAFKIDDRELEALLRFVGPMIYRAAGGRYELDLFADGPAERGRVVDEPLLRELAENKLGAIRQSLRERTGRSDLKFIAEPPTNTASLTDWSLLVEPDVSGDRIDLPRGDVAARIAIAEDGTHEIDWWWPSRIARQRSAKTTRACTRESGNPEQPGSTAAMEDGPQAYGATFTGGQALGGSREYAYAQAARAWAKERHGLTGDGLHVLRSLRTEILRALIVEDAGNGGTLGRDYLIWAQLRQRLGNDGWKDTGAHGLASPWIGSDDAEPGDVVKPHLEETNAHAVWLAAVNRIGREPFMTIEEPDEAFAAYVGTAEHVKTLAGAVLAGFALIRSANVPGWRVPAHDRLAHLTGAGNDGDLREHWQPTPRFMGLLPKLKRLELAQPHADPEAFPAWHKQKDAAIAGVTAQVLAETDDWIHPLLRFSRHAPGTLASAFEEAAG